MQISADKNKGSKGLSGTGNYSKNGSSLGFVDNRPEAGLIQKLREGIDKSSQTNLKTQFQTTAPSTVKNRTGLPGGTVQLKTNINHDTETFNAEGKGAGNFLVGTGMQAELDPRFPVIGSATSGETSSKLGAICKLFKPGLEQTHLLNADLGGFGVYENLYPMTPKANRDHFNQVERHVKEALLKAENNYFGKEKIPEKEGNGIYYEVSVLGDHSLSGLTSGTMFHCEAYYIDDIKASPAPNKNKPIVIDRLTSNPKSDGKPADFQGRNVVMKWWDHKQGEANYTASEIQKKWISKREGKADLGNKFSKYTAGKSWDDYRNSSISVDSDLFTTKRDHLESIVFKDYEDVKLLGMERFNSSIYTERLNLILKKIRNTPKHIILNSFEYVSENVNKDVTDTLKKIHEDDKAFWSEWEKIVDEDEDQADAVDVD